MSTSTAYSLTTSKKIINKEMENNEFFHSIRELAYKESGIFFDDEKKHLLNRKINNRMKALDIDNIKKYHQRLLTNNIEKTLFINAITTNITHFFREIHHYHYLKEVFFPKLINSNKKRLRIWSTASASGEEAYSIAILASEAKLPCNNIDTKILATDINTDVLKKSRKGVYKKSELKHLSHHQKKQWFSQTNDKDFYEIHPSIREMVSFNYLNLMDQWPMKKTFDVIFCRNILIYFDKKTQHFILSRLYEKLAPNGLLILGHSEPPPKNKKSLLNLGQTIYQKTNVV